MILPLLVKGRKKSNPWIKAVRCHYIIWSSDLTPAGIGVVQDPLLLCRHPRVDPGVFGVSAADSEGSDPDKGDLAVDQRHQRA